MKWNSFRENMPPVIIFTWDDFIVKWEILEICRKFSHWKTPRNMKYSDSNTPKDSKFTNIWLVFCFCFDWWDSCLVCNKYSKNFTVLFVPLTSCLIPRNFLCLISVSGIWSTLIFLLTFFQVIQCIYHLVTTNYVRFEERLQK